MKPDRKRDWKFSPTGGEAAGFLRGSKRADPSVAVGGPATHPRLLLYKDCVTHLIDAASATYPEECCGVLLGFQSVDFRLITIANVKVIRNTYPGDRTKCFAMCPDAVRRARGGGLDIVGFFHSHPRGVARPSAMDMALASPWLGYLHAIIGTSDAGTSKACFYQVGDKRWHQILSVDGTLW